MDNVPRQIVLGENNYYVVDNEASRKGKKKRKSKRSSTSVETSKVVTSYEHPTASSKNVESVRFFSKSKLGNNQDGSLSGDLPSYRDGSKHKYPQTKVMLKVAQKKYEQQGDEDSEILSSVEDTKNDDNDMLLDSLLGDDEASNRSFDGPVYNEKAMSRIKNNYHETVDAGSDEDDEEFGSDNSMGVVLHGRLSSNEPGENPFQHSTEKEVVEWFVREQMENQGFVNPHKFKKDEQAPLDGPLMDEFSDLEELQGDDANDRRSVARKKDKNATKTTFSQVAPSFNERSVNANNKAAATPEHSVANNQKRSIEKSQGREGPSGPAVNKTSKDQETRLVPISKTKDSKQNLNVKNDLENEKIFGGGNKNSSDAGRRVDTKQKKKSDFDNFVPVGNVATLFTNSKPVSSITVNPNSAQTNPFDDDSIGMSVGEGGNDNESFNKAAAPVVQASKTTDDRDNEPFIVSTRVAKETPKSGHINPFDDETESDESENEDSEYGSDSDSDSSSSEGSYVSACEDYTDDEEVLTNFRGAKKGIAQQTNPFEASSFGDEGRVRTKKSTNPFEEDSVVKSKRSQALVERKRSSKGVSKSAKASTRVTAATASPSSDRPVPKMAVQARKSDGASSSNEGDPKHQESIETPKSPAAYFTDMVKTTFDVACKMTGNTTVENRPLLLVPSEVIANNNPFDLTCGNTCMIGRPQKLSDETPSVPELSKKPLFWIAHPSLEGGAAAAAEDHPNLVTSSGPISFDESSTGEGVETSIVLPALGIRQDTKSRKLGTKKGVRGSKNLNRNATDDTSSTGSPTSIEDGTADDGSEDVVESSKRLLRMVDQRIQYQNNNDEVKKLRAEVEDKKEQADALTEQLRRAIETKCDLILSQTELERVYEIGMASKEAEINELKSQTKEVLEKSANIEMQFMNEIASLTDKINTMERSHRDEIEVRDNVIEQLQTEIKRLKTQSVRGDSSKSAFKTRFHQVRDSYIDDLPPIAAL